MPASRDHLIPASILASLYIQFLAFFFLFTIGFSQDFLSYYKVFFFEKHPLHVLFGNLE